MGKSTASCFRIISCAGDSVDNDDLQTPESKGSSDRRGWSFRKRSAAHRVLSNSVTSETPASASKESQESISVSCQVAEKSTEIQQKEEKKTELSSFLDSKLLNTQAPKEEDDAPPDEYNIILIQTAIRGFLARRVLLKQKSITKLQAVVRGHIVRSHAVGTLRCVRAIIKMQALVRARRARLLVQGSADILKHGESNRQSKKEARYTYVSIEKLLSNAFARQLMEATPKAQPINIKCDPLKSDSAWKWLERWMSVSSVSSEEAVEQHTDDDLGHSGRKEEDILEVQIISKPSDSESTADASNEISNDNDMTSYDANDLDARLSKSISSLSIHSSDQSDTECDLNESSSTEMKKGDLVEMIEVDLPGKEEEIPNEVVGEEKGIVQDAPDSENFSTETEVKKLSRKASNPAFVAAQSKFEELSLAATSVKITPGVESSLEKVSVLNASAAHRGSSECGTELSVSSTLDSPERSEAEAEVGIKDRGMELNAPNETADNHRNSENLEIEAKSVVVETDPSSNNKLERYESVDSSLNSGMIMAHEPQPNDSSQVELGSETSHPVNNASLEEASPRSHATIPESQPTPSSQVSSSVKPKKKSKGEKSRKSSRQTLDDVKLSNQNQDSDKLGKRRNSFGEARDSNCVPSYMQATESARAKAIVNGSPRSSPDVYIKKRHSLPATVERQGSPRIHRSLSQAQQNTKGNATHSPQDRKWRR